MRYLIPLLACVILFSTVTTSFALQDSKNKTDKTFIVKEKEKKAEPDKKGDLSPDVQELYDKAVRRFDAKDYDDAIGWFNKVIQLVPDYIPAYRYRGFAFIEKGKVSKDIFENGNKSYDKYLYEYKQARDNFSRIIKLNPELSFAYFYRAAAYIGLDYYPQLAIDDMNLYIDKFKMETPAAFCQRGIAYYQRGYIPEAMVDLKHAIDLDIKYRDAYIYLWKSYDVLKNYDDAGSYFGSLIKEGSDNAFPWYYRGLSYLEKQEYAKAIADFDMALFIYPDYTDAKNKKNEAKRLLK